MSELCEEALGGSMDSRKSADVSCTLRDRTELEEELYSSEYDDENECDDDLFDADELGLDPEEDDQYYAATELLTNPRGQSAWLAAIDGMAV
jgi:hypothetical protein